MADLSRDRGQLILVGGFVIAVTFVALALILNSVIFTENLATRGESIGGSGGAETRDIVDEATGDLIAHANAHNNTEDDFPAQNVSAGVADLDTALGAQLAARGQILDVRYVETVNGTRIAHNDTTQPFVAANGSADWSVQSGVEQVRDVGLNVSRSSLVTGSPGSCGGCFEVTFSDGIDDWSVRIYDDGSEVAVTSYVNGNPEGTCTTPGPNAEINVTTGVVGDRECQPLLFGEGLDRTSTLDVSIDNGDQAAGRYSLVTDTSPSLVGVLLDGPGSSGSPRETYAVYSTDVIVDYQTGTTNYNATVRVAPGEPR
jgi:hypothetical protein